MGDGGADDSAAIQSALDAGEPRVVIPVGIYRLAKGLRLHSDTHLWVHPRAQLIFADGAGAGVDDFLLTNADPEGGNQNIVVEGGIWDGNNPGNPRGPDAPDSYTGVSVNFTNVVGLTLRKMALRDAESYFVLLGKVRDFRIEDIAFEIRHLRPNQDGIHISGHCEDGVIRNIIGHGSQTPNDDMVAILADDALNRAQNLKAFNGPIRRMRVEHLRADSCHSFLRLLSVDHPIEDIEAHDIKGGCCCCAINMDACRECRVKLFNDCDRPGGVGQIKRVRIYDIEVFKATDTNHQPLIDFRTRADDVVIEGFRRDERRDVSPETPTLIIEKAGALTTVLEGLSEQWADGFDQSIKETNPDERQTFRVTQNLASDDKLTLPAGGFARLSVSKH
jgi:hypothetical protein